MQIYCDMDGVLCDFHAAVLDMFGEPLQGNKIPEPEKWSIIEQHPEFWTEMEWMPDGRQVWEFVKPYNPDVLSAVVGTRPENSFKGKTLWVLRNLFPFNIQKLHLVRRNEKQVFAKSGLVTNVLVDDDPKNIREWTYRGGVAIFHTSANNSIMELRKLGF